MLPAMPNMEQPAGFFSTFSILDPNGIHEGNPRAQKRNRRVFVCIPCHRRKLKCDKGQPCSRCTQSGSVHDCIYQPVPNNTKRESQSRTPEPKSSPSRKGSSSNVQDSVRSCYRAGDGRARVSGTTHWAKIACEVSSLRRLWDQGFDTDQPVVRGSLAFRFWNTITVGCKIPPDKRTQIPLFILWFLQFPLQQCSGNAALATHHDQPVTIPARGGSPG